ncbi:hypothetical protein Hanom_Chr01g00088431 [Helianthus anomalus]
MPHNRRSSRLLVFIISIRFPSHGNGPKLKNEQLCLLMKKTKCTLNENMINLNCPKKIKNA